MQRNEEIDFGWFQPFGKPGTRLSWNRATRTLYLYHADADAEEVLCVCEEGFARWVGDVWLTLGGPEYVRELVER